MKTVAHFGEKRFIRKILSRYAATAREDAIDDSIIIDLSGLRTGSQTPLVVYSMDHPGRIDRPVPEGFETRFYGRWVAACTCNDVLAMGAKPRGFSLDLAVREDTEIDSVAQLYEGVCDILRIYQTAFEGGNVDINDRVETVALCWGTVDRSGIIRRHGARPGDLIAVTSELGIGWASFVLRRNGRFKDLTRATQQSLREYNLLPIAPYEAILETVRLMPGAITSGMDLSDGLAEFLYTIAEIDGLGVVVEEERIPASSLLTECASLMEVPAPLLALELGYDTPRGHGYTVDPDRWSHVKDLFNSLGADIYHIGYVTESGKVLWKSSGGLESRIPELWDDKCNRPDAVREWYNVIGGGTLSCEGRSSMPKSGHVQTRLAGIE